MSLRLAISLGTTLSGADVLPRLLRLAALAEDAGVDEFGVADHVVFSADASGYPYGKFPVPPDNPYPEPLTLCAAVAAATSRITLCPSTLIVPLRPAALLAKTCATIDRLSGGRLILGAGAGWLEAEFAASGIPFARRGARMDDTLRACRALWAGGAVSFESETVSFEDVICEPSPSRPDSIRIIVGGKDVARTARRIADYADGWIPPTTISPSELANALDQIREARAAAGRATDDLEIKYGLPVAGGDIARTLADTVPGLAAAGATTIQVPVGSFVDGPDQAPAFIERLVELFQQYRSA